MIGPKKGDEKTKTKTGEKVKLYIWMNGINPIITGCKEKYDFITSDGKVL